MSLLLDALRQAEESKKRPAQEPHPSDDSGAIPVEVVREIKEELKLESDIEDDFTIDEEFLNEQLEIVSTPQSEKSISADNVLEREEPFLTEDIDIDSSTNDSEPELHTLVPLDPTLNIFNAGEKKSLSSNKYKLWLLFIAIMVIAIIIFFWLLQSNNSNEYVEEELIFEEEIGSKESQPSSIDTQLNIEGKNYSSKSSASTEVVSSKMLKQLANVVNDQVNKVAKKQTTASTSSNINPKSSVKDEKLFAQKTSIIEIKRRVLPRQISSSISQAYELLLTGEYSLSREIYEQVLNQRPKQVSVLLGLAKINSHEGKLPEARRLYNRVLEIDSSNTIAQLGLLYSYGKGNSQYKLAALRDLSSKFPENSQIFVSLGHELSVQSKWSEAQEAYFQAFSLDSLNAVYAYNLAVSLDRLEKYEAAKQFYNQSITLNSEKSMQLNTILIKERLLQLGKL